MKKYLLILLFLLVPNLARAQVKLSAASTDCTVTNACLSVVVTTAGSATFTVSANASSNTIQFEAGTTDSTGVTSWYALTAYPSNSTTGASSTTSTGIWQANVGAYTNIRMRMSTLSGGTTTVNINQSPASASSGRGGSGGITISANQIGYGTGTNTIGGNANLTWNNSTQTLTATGTGGILTTNQTVSSSPCVGIETGLVSPAGVFACSGLSNPIQTVGSVQFNAGAGFGSTVFNDATGYLTFEGGTSGGAGIGVAAVAGTPCTILWPTLSPTAGQVLSSAAPSGSPSTCQTSWTSNILSICTTCVTSAASLTVNQPVVGGGSQATVALATTFSSLTTTCTSAQTWAIASAWVANASITITGSCTLNLTNPLAGGNYVLVVTQGSGGSHTLTLGTGCTWKVSGGGGGAITPTTTAAAIDVLAFTYDGANCYANYNKNFN